ncbi:hypothetical protein J3L18_02880 [Mucilaginibacter gossypii]|uniref:hypothetical protein n=1 Tax=Mucilaginibacter gossypii TaxID=551996 RepID=UPI000DCE2455|nr:MULTISPECIES: hypothetical protein [Mucilaginibacter]QTE38034.1 hypothetical protein J3L18_02880 [Mucilaginibacter gossypii]RAV58648.1 hypothetical protein DIU36_09235 [Mucilaginibacter rubeus]
MKALARQLFKTFLFSVIISIVASAVYYSLQQKGVSQDLNGILPSLSESVALLNIFILIMTLPMLFLANPVYYNNLSIRLVLYFSGAVVFVITAFRLQLNPENKTLYFITAISFIVVHSVFYYLMTKKRR